jgi:hypothetical protein
MTGGGVKGKKAKPYLKGDYPLDKPTHHAMMESVVERSGS